jgi:hypothetical protein
MVGARGASVRECLRAPRRTARGLQELIRSPERPTPVDQRPELTDHGHPRHTASRALKSHSASQAATSSTFGGPDPVGAVWTSRCPQTHPLARASSERSHGSSTPTSRVTRSRYTHPWVSQMDGRIRQAEDPDRSVPQPPRHVRSARPCSANAFTKDAGSRMGIPSYASSASSPLSPVST